MYHSPRESSKILFQKISLYVPSQLHSTSMTRIILFCAAESYNQPNFPFGGNHDSLGENTNILERVGQF